MIIDTTCSVIERKMKEERETLDELGSIIKTNRSFNEPSGWIDGVFISNRSFSDEEVAKLSGGFTCSMYWKEISIPENVAITAEVPAITWTTAGVQSSSNSVAFNFFD